MAAPAAEGSSRCIAARAVRSRARAPHTRPVATCAARPRRAAPAPRPAPGSGRHGAGDIFRTREQQTRMRREGEVRWSSATAGIREAARRRSPRT
eukprot:4365573-Prymnesium_polylepis.1